MTNNTQPITTIAESKELRGLNLIAAHSHIRGLGVDDDTLEPKVSSQGLVFKNTQVATILTARVYQGGVEATGAALTALGTVKWYKDGTYMTGKDGITLTIAAGDVADRATYEARLEY